MRKTIKKPDWFNLKKYEKTLSPKQWLDEISIRVSLLAKFSNPNLPLEDAKEIFLEMIKGKDKKKISESLIPHPHHPINPLNMIDVLVMSKRITNSHQYITHSNKEKIEEIIDARYSDKQLTSEQKKFYEEFMDIPWYAFENNGNPFTKLKYMYGTPLSINLNVERHTLKSNLNKYINNYLEHKNLNKKMPPIIDAMNNWAEKKTLAVFDLIFWFTICSIPLENHKTKISKIIWPITPDCKKGEKSEADPAEYLDIAIKLSQKVINPATMNGLLIYCESHEWNI